jgi:hypothetical protein
MLSYAIPYLQGYVLLYRLVWASNA